MALEHLSEMATQGKWVVRKHNKLGSDIYVSGGGSYIGSFRSNSELPDHHFMQMIKNAEFTAALVNAYREGRLVEKTDSSKEGL